MGDANTHNNSRLPVLLAGGPYKHGSHQAIDRNNPSDTTPLMGDLFLTLMQSMGLDTDRFANAEAEHERLSALMVRRIACLPAAITCVATLTLRLWPTR